MFADYTTVLIQENYLNSLTQKLQLSLNKITTKCKTSKSKSNINPTKIGI